MNKEKNILERADHGAIPVRAGQAVPANARGGPNALLAHHDEACRHSGERTANKERHSRARGNPNDDGGDLAEGGYPFHGSCAAHHFLCGGCNRIVHEDDGARIADTGVMVCNSCLDKRFCGCEECGRYVSEDNSFALASGGRVCGHCLEQGGYSRCPDCGGMYRESDRNFDGEDGCCDDCFWIRLGNIGRASHPYLYDPD
jgi:hypothetical protein